MGHPKLRLDMGGFRGFRGFRAPTPTPMNNIYVMPHALLSMATLFRNVSYIVFKAKTRPPIDTLQKERAPKKPL